jgi:hypothetical protein
MITRAALILVTALTAGAVRPAAHHAIGAIYDGSRMVTISGEVVRVVLRNPHSFVDVVIREPKKPGLIYSIEWTASDRLGMQGVTSTTLKAGDRVIVTGQPARDADSRLRMTMLRRPKDGFVWAPRPDAMD